MRLQREEGIGHWACYRYLLSNHCGYVYVGISYYIYIWLIGLALADHPTTDDLSRTIAYDWFSTW